MSVGPPALSAVPAPGLRRAWWLREALPLDRGEPCPPLRTDLAADVLILGGGYTGLWTAYFLTELAPEATVVLLEADICGGGPSGRNGGFATAWWDELPSLVRLFGERRAVEACLASAESVAAIGQWCARHDVDAWFTPAGYLLAATSGAQRDAWTEAVETAARLGVADRFRPLSPMEVRARCASPAFGGGAFMPDAATVQPARLARGLRRVALERGVRIFEGSPVRRWRATPRVEAETPGGSVRAGRLVLGLNAWAAVLPPFRRSLVAWSSYIVLTAPAPDRLAELGWTRGECITDWRASVRYFRTTPDGRIAMGGGGGRAGTGGRIDRRFTHDHRAAGYAAEGLRLLFPSFERVAIEDSWGGPIDVSGTHLPVVGTLPPGTVHYAHGYTGNGVGPSHVAGMVLASLAADRDHPWTRLPLVDAEPKRFPPEPLRTLGAHLVREAVVRKERAEERGRRVGPLTDLVARLPRRLGYALGPH